MPSRRWLFILVSTALTLLATGCGSRGVGATCAGTVTIDGKPAPAGIRVDFQPQGPQGSPSMAITDAAGKYDLHFTAARKGVMPGECLVRVAVMRERSAQGIPMVPEALKAVVIPEHYGEGSTLVRTVKPGHNQIDIEIDTTSPPARLK
jgi:hypothetical protein